MSVVAEGWKWPARRLLFRTVRIRINIRSWERLQEKVEDWAGVEIRTLDIYFGDCSADQQKAAKAVFELLKKVPNLRQLRFEDLPFTSFNTVDSTAMQATLLLLHLSDLDLSNFGSPNPFPQSVCFDLLKTSGHRISRFAVYGYRMDAIAPSEEHQLDFGGNLRSLEISGGSYQLLLQPSQIDLVSLTGLPELRVHGRVDDRTIELFAVIGPTLDKLTIISNYPASVAQYLLLLTHLSGLHLFHVPSESALFSRLPPSLSFLRLSSDNNLAPILIRWNVESSLVPATLKHIEIDRIANSDTWRLLPSLNKLGTSYSGRTTELLAQLSPNTTSFKVLEMYFPREYEARIPAIGAECKRLGVEFCRRIAMRAWI